MAQHTSLYVLQAEERVDNLSIRCDGNGVYGKVAQSEILLHQGSLIAVNSLSSRQRVLLLRLRMQEYPEIPADRLETESDKCISGDAGNQPVPFGAGLSQHPIAYRSANKIGIHCRDGRWRARVLQGGIAITWEHLHRDWVTN